METPTVQLLTKLEQQLHTLVARVNQLTSANQSLQQALEEANEKLEKKHQSMRNWQEKYDALKAAQGINTGDTTARKKALHHIDALISEVDSCIAQLEIKE
jgi:chromosome segregation ATPase